MLKLLKNSPQDGSATAKPMDGVKLIDLMQYFPIGCGVRFYPEFQKDIVLQSIVIGSQQTLTSEARVIDAVD